MLRLAVFIFAFTALSAEASAWELGCRINPIISDTGGGLSVRITNRGQITLPANKVIVIRVGRRDGEITKRRIWAPLPPSGTVSLGVSALGNPNRCSAWVDQLVKPDLPPWPAQRLPDPPGLR